MIVSGMEKSDFQNEKGVRTKTVRTATQGGNRCHFFSLIVLLVFTFSAATSAAKVSLEEKDQHTDVAEPHRGGDYRGLERLSTRTIRPLGFSLGHHGKVPETLRPKPETLSPGPLQPLQEPTIKFYSSNRQSPQQTFSTEGVLEPPPKESERLKDRITQQIQTRLGAQNRQGPQQQVQLSARTSGTAPDAALWTAAIHSPRGNDPVNRQGGNMAFNVQSLLVNPSTRAQTQKPQVDIIGGVGNPALMGVPINLGNSNSYLVPSDNRKTTPQPLFGGVGDSLRQSSPLVFSGSLGNNNKQFVSLRNQSPVHTASPLTIQSQSTPSLNGFGSLSNPSLAAQSSLLSASQPANFNQLVKVMQAAFDTNPSLRNYMLRLLSSVKTPSSGIGSSLGPLSPQISQHDSALSLNAAIQNLGQTPAPHQSKQQSNAGQLSQYYQQSSLNPAYQYQQNNFPLRIPGAFHSDALPQASSPPILPADQPYFPAEHSPLSIVNSPAADSQNDILGTPAISPTAQITPEAATVGYSNVQGCIKDTWCALALAAAVAIGATSTLAVPFLAPALFGRRRRDLQYLVFSQEEAPVFTDHFMRFMKGDMTDIPEEEVMLFRSLKDPADNRVKRMFENVKHFIISNEEKLLNITIQEIKNERHILIPDDILERISNKSRESLHESIAVMLDLETRNKSENHSDTEANIASSDLPNSLTVYRPQEVYQPVTEAIYIPGLDYSTMVNRPVVSNSGQGSVQVQKPMYANTAQGYQNLIYPHLAIQQQRLQHYFSPYYSNPLALQTYNSNSHNLYGHSYPQYGHNIPLHFSSSGNRDSFPVNYHPHSRFGHHHYPGKGQQNDVLVIPNPATQQQRPLMSPDAVTFYREVCLAVRQDDVPNNEITRFISQKCALFYYSGII
ncbi:uncharacterized protein LOC125026227 [Penaeus chinensis]|uniref:uncharacterized protein LOC125026227 n=1 Tax=Penaeus chinensis TaxID=139456 RepID=UPI001FB76BEC|nr:uncharacterized protein LOC125026227 [Penaeus chinensis]